MQARSRPRGREGAGANLENDTERNAQRKKTAKIPKSLRGRSAEPEGKEPERGREPEGEREVLLKD